MSHNELIPQSLVSLLIDPTDAYLSHWMELLAMHHADINQHHEKVLMLGLGPEYQSVAELCRNPKTERGIRILLVLVYLNSTESARRNLLPAHAEFIQAFNLHLGFWLVGRDPITNEAFTTIREESHSVSFAWEMMSMFRHDYHLRP